MEMSEEENEYSYLSPWSRFPLEKPIVSQPVKNLPDFMEPRVSLLGSQQSAVCSCSLPH